MAETPDEGWDTKVEVAEFAKYQRLIAIRDIDTRLNGMAFVLYSGKLDPELARLPAFQDCIYRRLF
jgi:hypothetical protein